MCPFHKVYLLELVEGHVWIKEGEFGGGFIFCKLAVPVGLIHGRPGAGDRAPFSDAETGRRQSGVMPPK